MVLSPVGRVKLKLFAFFVLKVENLSYNSNKILIKDCDLRYICAIMAACAVFGVALRADSPINTDKILKSNQAIVFNAKTNTISYVLEITPDGKIIKKFLSNDEKQKLIKAFNLGADSATSKASGNLKESGDSKVANANQSANSAISGESKIDKYPNSHIKEWDKSKIIYEQVVDRINILR